MSNQKSLVKEQVMRKCSRELLSRSQNVHKGEVAKPILWRNEFVVKYLFKILYWDSRDLVSVRTLKGNL